MSDKKIRQIDICKKLFNENGYKPFFRGFGVTVVRAFFQNGIIFELNEICQDYFIKLNKNI